MGPSRIVRWASAFAYGSRMAHARRLRFILCLAAMLPTICLAAPASAPSPDLSAVQVVQLQLRALQHNDVPHADAGIALVYAFTTPRNRAQTGPLSRFSNMIHRGYAGLLDHQSATLAPARIDGDRALQGVELIDHAGSVREYVFLLSRMHAPPYAECWMVDGVVERAVPRPSQAL